MAQPCFDSYHRYEPLTEMLRAYAARYPRLMRLESIGRSHEGRDIWLAVVTAFEHGADQDKPAFWVDGNIHAAELAGSSACLYALDHLLCGYGNDPEVTRCLDTRVFYLCPRVNPDGAEWALADKPKIVRSSVRPYPYDEEPLGGLVTEDMDGDGRILTMRIPDPNGPWKVCPQEPRLLVARDPVESGGRYYRLLPEGRLEDYDGITINLQKNKEALDLNRNFPVQWREEHDQTGAGPYPGSEPEVQAIIRFIAAHPNICGGVSFHSYSGVLLRPYSYQGDNELPAEDLWTFEKIGAKGSELTGYPAACAYEAFRYHPKQVITGAFDDWLYEHGGLFAWTVEIWSPQREAGIQEYKFIDWYRDHPLEDDLKMLRWSDEVLHGRGYIDWYPFEHPQLGPVELGGWDPLYTFWNPPRDKLQAEIARFPQWLIWHNLLSPRLELRETRVSALGDNHFSVRLTVGNSGWLPSYVTKKAQQKQLTRGVVGEIDLPAGAKLTSGQRRVVAAQLEGRAYKPCAPTGWAGQAADITDERVKLEWTVYAPQGGTVRLRAHHQRAGVVRAELELK